MITNLSDQLIRDEGEILHVYPDKYGYLTIGVGRLVDPRKGGCITKEESRILLSHDISERELLIVKNLPWVMNLDLVRRAVLTNVAFNVGFNGLMQFQHTLDAIRTGKFAAAAVAMQQSLWAKQLPERSKRLAEQMKSGEWQ